MAQYKFSMSYSRWSLWDKCPAAFKYKNIDKLPEEPSAALAKGRKDHDDIAKWLMFGGDMPDTLRNFTMMAASIAKVEKSNLAIETKMAFDTRMLPVKYMGANAYWRFVWDVGIKLQENHVDAIDWKTGRPYDSYDDQQELFALPAFWQDSRVETFTGHWVYLDHSDVHTRVFTRSEVVSPGGLQDKWIDNARRMESDRDFKPTPSRDACKWCNFHWRKGGPCREGV